MSTSVVHPGAAKAPSGKTIGMLVGGLAVAIVLGFVFYLNQSQDVTVSDAGTTQTAESLTDMWQIRHQAEVNAARDQAFAYETARIQAQGLAQQPATTSSVEMVQQAIADSLAELESARSLQPLPEIVYRVPEVDATSIIQGEIAAALAAHQAAEQARIERQSEAFGLNELFVADTVSQAWTDRLTGLAESVTVDPAAQAWTDRLTLLSRSVNPMIAPSLNELSLYKPVPVVTPMIAPRLDELSYWANQTVNGVFAHETGGIVDFYEKYDVPADGSHINPAFDHEVN